MAVILVINDDGPTLDMYESVLIALGHEPVTKVTVASGPETIRDVGAEALVVDLQSANDDDYGLRIIEDLRADGETRAIPIVMCTGARAAVESLRPRLAELGVPVVMKPFAMHELEQALASAMDGHGMGDREEMS